MADIKFFEITDLDGAEGTHTINWADMPTGLSFSRSHVRPQFPVRLANGALVVQALDYNKKDITLNGLIFTGLITLHLFLQEVWENGSRVTLKIFYQNTAFADIEEFNATSRLLEYNDSADKANNKRTFTAFFSEV